MRVPDSFVDTNILVYAVDKADSKKHAIALSLIRDLAVSGRLVVSTQVLQEFYNVATKKLHISNVLARRIIDALAAVKTVNATRKLVLEAIDLNIRHQFSMWDSLVLAAAHEAGCRYFYSEDMNAGQSLYGMTIVNPFSDCLD